MSFEKRRSVKVDCALNDALGTELLCAKCKIQMKTGKALQNNLSGIPDFVGDDHCCTVSPDGTARLIDCLKCPECGKCVSP